MLQFVQTIELLWVQRAVKLSRYVKIISFVKEKISHDYYLRAVNTVFKMYYEEEEESLAEKQEIVDH